MLTNHPVRGHWLIGLGGGAEFHAFRYCTINRACDSFWSILPVIHGLAAILGLLRKSDPQSAPVIFDSE